MLSLVRDPLSYFRSYRNYFIAIYGAFLAFPVAELITIFYQDPAMLHFSTQLFIIGGVVVATLWGHVATKLHLYPERFSLRSALANLRRPIYLAYVLYLVPMVLAIVISWGIPSSINADPKIGILYVLDGTTHRAAVLGPLLLAIGASVTLAFIFYPALVLTNLRAQLKDREVRNALRVIAYCFGGVATCVLFGDVLSTLGYDILGPVYLASVLLLIIAVRAFRKPTFLKAFLGVVPSLETTPSGTRSDQMVLLYNAVNEELGTLTRYIEESIVEQNRVIYFYDGDEALVRELLTSQGVNVKQHMLKGNLRFFPLGSLYQSPGLLDEDAAIDTCRELVSETRTLGKGGLRIIVDYGENSRRPFQKFVDHLADPRWTSPDHYVHVLMAFAKSVFEGQENVLTLLRSKLPVLDVSESIDVFSRTVGLTHQEIVGKKILFEYDPLSDYDRVLKALVAEASFNFERTVVFTRRDSPLYWIVWGEPRLRIFTLTSRVSSPRVEGENRILLPAYDSSLLLDALNKTIEAYRTGSFTIIFDNVSHYIFTQGRDRTYSLVRQAMELMISDKITAIFLLNSGAHDQKTVSAFEDFFDVEIVCNVGARAPEVRKKLGLTA